MVQTVKVQKNTILKGTRFPSKLLHYTFCSLPSEVSTPKGELKVGESRLFPVAPPSGRTAKLGEQRKKRYAGPRGSFVWLRRIVHVETLRKWYLPIVHFVSGESEAWTDLEMSKNGTIPWTKVGSLFFLARNECLFFRTVLVWVNAVASAEKNSRSKKLATSCWMMSTLDLVYKRTNIAFWKK